MTLGAWPGLCASWPSWFSCFGLRVESPGKRTKEEGLRKAAVLAGGQPGARVRPGGAGYPWRGGHFERALG